MTPAVSLQTGLMFVALLFIVGGFLMRRTARRRLPANDAAGVASQTDRLRRRIEGNEARLHDYARACDAEYQTRAAALRGLIADADAAAARLAVLLAETQSRGDLGLLPIDELSRAARSLKQAGYSDEQVDKLLERSESDHRPHRRAA